jgi:hypothetical protein
MIMWKPMSAIFILVAALAAGAVLQAQQAPPPAQAAAGAQPDQVAAVKQSLQQGLGLARKYEWIETTTISLKGEQKAKKQNRCYYGADGTVQKISIDQPAPPAQEPSGGRGGRGGRVKAKVVENKKDEMKEYMEKAAGLIHQYVPPNPQQIQAAKDAGRVAMTPQAGGAVKIVIAQYLLPGDSLTIDLDQKTGKLLGLGVASYIEKKDDAVTLAVQMTSLADGALFAGQTTLEAKAKNITVVIRNSGFRPVQQ